MKNRKLGFALCGSFCTIDKATDAMEKLISLGYDVTPIMSENCYSIDTRFGTADSNINTIEGICQKKILHTIVQAEPIGPNNMLDLLIIAPCTGNTLAKLAHSVTDTAVTMAVKSHLRNEKPVLIALATNDALAGTLKNIGILMQAENYFFVPTAQDNPTNKPRSMVADFNAMPNAVELALQNKQMQPILTKIEA